MGKGLSSIFLVVLILGCLAPPESEQEEPEAFKIAREFNYEEVFKAEEPFEKVGYYPHIDPKKSKVEMKFWSSSFLNLSDPEGILLNFWVKYSYIVIVLKNDSEYELYAAVYGSPTGEKEIKHPQPLTLMRFANPEDSRILYTTFMNVTVVEMMMRKGVDYGEYDVKQYVIIDDRTKEVAGIITMTSPIYMLTDDEGGTWDVIVGFIEHKLRKLIK